MWINANPELSGGGEGGTPSVVRWRDIQDKPTEFKPEKHTHIIADITELPEIIEELKDKDFGLQEQIKLVISDLSKKVDTEEGKGLSTNDFTDSYKQKVDGLTAAAEDGAVLSVNGKTGLVTLDASDIGLGNVLDVKQATEEDFLIFQDLVTEELAKKVTVEEGKGLSTNDFTDELKEKLENLNETPSIDNYVVSVNGKSGEVEITKADLDLSNVENIKQASYEDLINLKTIVENNQKDIANKVDKKEGFGLSQENFTPELKKKLEGLENGGIIEPSGDYVISVNGKTGEVTIDKETVELGNVINERQATQQELETVQNALTELIKSKVDKKEGKGLSEQNYTLSEKEKLASLEQIDLDNELKPYATKLDLEAHSGNELIHVSEADREKLAELDTIDENLTTLQTELEGKASKEELDSIAKNKVDKIEGKHLSDENFTSEEKDKLALLDVHKQHEFEQHTQDKSIHVTSEEKENIQSIPSLDTNITNLQKSLEKKVDKEVGKGLSTNDFTDEDKTNIQALDKEVERILELLGEGEEVTESGIIKVIKKGHLYAIGDVIYDVINRNTVTGSLAYRFVYDNINLFENKNFQYNKLWVNISGTLANNADAINKEDGLWAGILEGMFDIEKAGTTEIVINDNPSSEPFPMVVKYLGNRIYFDIHSDEFDEMGVVNNTCSIVANVKGEITTEGESNAFSTSIQNNIVNNDIYFNSVKEHEISVHQKMHYNAEETAKIENYEVTIDIHANRIEVDENIPYGTIYYENNDAKVFEAYEGAGKSIAGIRANVAYNDFNSEVARRFKGNIVYLAERMSDPDKPLFNNISMKHYANMALDSKATYIFGTNELDKETKASTKTKPNNVALRNTIIVNSLDEIPDEVKHEGLIAIVLES